MEARDDSTDEDGLHIGHNPGINDEIHNEYDENQLIDFPYFCEMVRAQNPSRGEVSFDEIDSAFRSMAFVPGQNGAVLLEQAQQIVTERFQSKQPAREERGKKEHPKVGQHLVTQSKHEQSKIGKQLMDRKTQLNYLDEHEKQLLSAIMLENTTAKDASITTVPSDPLAGEDDAPYGDFAALLQPDSTVAKAKAAVETPRGIDFAEYCELVRDRGSE